jgi:hypothetical protein
MPRQTDTTLPARVEAYLALALFDAAKPISVRAVADAVGVSRQSLYSHDSRLRGDGGECQQLLPLIASAAERQARMTNRIRPLAD